SLWELYNHLKKCDISNDSIYQYFYNNIKKLIPEKYNNSKQINENLIQLIDPSTRIEKKIETLGSLKKISTQEQKKILERWNELVNEYVASKSDLYFHLLTQDNSYYKGILIAAGEGSGSAGLLNEYETLPDDSSRRGNGKGAGLFTYELKIEKEGLTVHSKPQIEINSLKEYHTMLHFSLWGMNSTLKPTIVIKINNKSYLLYANYQTKDLSPDPLFGKGKTYHDLLEDYKTRKIEKNKEELYGENGLQSTLTKEFEKRENLLNLITKEEEEIDSLDPTKENYLQVVENKKQLINSYKESLKSRRERIFSLEQKVKSLNLEIYEAEKEYEKMKAKLGENIQQWNKIDSLYIFEDNTVFNYLTQDLIFPALKNEEPINIQLLAMGVNLFAQKVDEVQLYVNITDGERSANFYKKEHLPEITKEIYFKSDEFETNLIFSDHELNILDKYNSLINKNPDKLIVKLIAGGIYSNDSIDRIDVLKKSEVSYPGKSIEEKKKNKNLPQYTNARKSIIQLNHLNDTVYFIIKSYTDPIKTNLSKLQNPDWNKIKNYYNEKQEYNIYLSGLRTHYSFKSCCDFIDHLEKLKPKIKLYNYLIDLDQINYQ
ncbi:MAG: hypothetical protein JXB17_13680, partial [Bacteroidales bacterium]|nr:hypothetical protein [Bacteroidales bacterium]